MKRPVTQPAEGGTGIIHVKWSSNGLGFNAVETNYI